MRKNDKSKKKAALTRFPPTHDIFVAKLLENILETVFDWSIFVEKDFTLGVRRFLSTFKINICLPTLYSARFYVTKIYHMRKMRYQ